ncbi:unnamed protein product [Allacma fusca]|uniref:Fork-head domain-containing protein n=1 Tax=Allacma fusca TaxID=39272 RepID=A0A8J2KPN8_9HEXA|nr:unnamed protein product [Allacma fusca]
MLLKVYKKEIQKQVSETTHEVCGLQGAISQICEVITNKKPPLSYSSLITKAIKSNSNNKLTLSQIYSWIKENYLYYSTAEPSWQNSIRHNLSLNKCFVKIPRGKDEPGKGGFWSLDESLIGRSGSKRKKKKKKNNLAINNLSNNDINLILNNSNNSDHSNLSSNVVHNNNTIILSNSDEGCIDICQEDFSTQEETVESEIIESELILENVYWESVLDLDHLISIGEL